MIRTMVVIFLAAQVMACSLPKRCFTDDTYLDARSSTPLLVPEDLATPETDHTYRVPPPVDLEERLADGRCYDDPPPMPATETKPENAPQS